MGLLESQVVAMSLNTIRKASVDVRPSKQSKPGIVVMNNTIHVSYYQYIRRSAWDKPTMEYDILIYKPQTVCKGDKRFVSLCCQPH